MKKGPDIVNGLQPAAISLTQNLSIMITDRKEEDREFIHFGIELQLFLVNLAAYIESAP
jgi:hypothetical protein